MKFSLKDRLLSFRHAFAGLGILVATQHNFRIHLAASILVCLLGLVLGLSVQEWLWITLSITFVLITEAANTAIESLGDAITREPNEQIRVAKDVAAAMVLIASIAAAGIGLVIFIPKVWNSIAVLWH